MNRLHTSDTQSPNHASSTRKRTIFSMGGKGGVGKTSVMTGLAEWLHMNQIPVTLLDLDTENKARGSLTHFGGQVPKVNIHTPAGLDAFIDHLADGAPVVLADMGAGSGQVTYDWFDTMYTDLADAGIAFTTVGIVTADPASVESVLSWARHLQSRVAYLIVENSITAYCDFTYWRATARHSSSARPLRPPSFISITASPSWKTPRAITALPWAASPQDEPTWRNCVRPPSSCGPKATGDGCLPSSTG